MAKKYKKGSIIYLTMILILLISLVTYSLCYLQLAVNNRISSLNNYVTELRKSKEKKYIEDESAKQVEEQISIMDQRIYDFCVGNDDETMRRN